MNCLRKNCRLLVGWLRKNRRSLWWALPLAAVSIVAWFISREGVPFELVGAQLEVQDAKKKARAIEIDQGADFARYELEREHAETMKRLNDDSKALAVSLRSNPGELAAFLVREGRKARREQGL